MSDEMVLLVGLVGAILVVGGIAHLLERRAKRKGDLFTRPASPNNAHNGFRACFVVCWRLSSGCIIDRKL